MWRETKPLGLQRGWNVGTRQNQGAPGNADNAFLWTAPASRRQTGGRLFGDVGTNDGEITGGEFKEIRAGTSIDTQGGIRLWTKAS